MHPGFSPLLDYPTGADWLASVCMDICPGGSYDPPASPVSDPGSEVCTEFREDIGKVCPFLGHFDDPFGGQEAACLMANALVKCAEPSFYPRLPPRHTARTAIRRCLSKIIVRVRPSRRKFTRSAEGSLPPCMCSRPYWYILKLIVPSTCVDLKPFLTVQFVNSDGKIVSDKLRMETDDRFGVKGPRSAPFQCPKGIHDPLPSCLRDSRGRELQVTEYRFMFQFRLTSSKINNYRFIVGISEETSGLSLFESEPVTSWARKHSDEESFWEGLVDHKQRSDAQARARARARARAQQQQQQKRNMNKKKLKKPKVEVSSDDYDVDDAYVPCCDTDDDDHDDDVPSLSPSLSRSLTGRKRDRETRDRVKIHAVDVVSEEDSKEVVPRKRRKVSIKLEKE